jgi:GT2 family glycosyltransferase
MPFQIVDLNWEHEFPKIVLKKGYKGILGLVYFRGKPVGLVRVWADNGLVIPQTVQSEILNQVGDPNLWTSSGPDSDRLVTVVVCTRGRPDLLANCLQGLIPFYQKGHEIIVVDNAPENEETALLVKRFSFKYLVEPQIGLNHARNCGLNNASQKIIAFTDDDCFPDTEWLKALTGPYEDQAVWGTTGLVIPYELETEAQERFEDYCANRRILLRRDFSSPPMAPSEAGMVGMGANMSFRREVLERVGGFDTRFDGGTPTMSGGDTEIFARILDSGGRIVYRPDALIRHRHVRENQALRKVVYGYGVGLYAFLTKRLIEDRDWSVLITAPRWLGGPPMKALYNRVVNRPASPWDLVLYEFSGALRGPFRFFVVRKDQRYRRYKELGV